MLGISRQGKSIRGQKTPEIKKDASTKLGRKIHVSTHMQSEQIRN